MEIVDLCSDGENTVDLCSDGEDSDSTHMCSDGEDSDSTHMSSDSEDEHDYHDHGNRFRQQQHLHSLSIAASSDTSSDEEPIMMDADGFMRTHQAYRPAKNASKNFACQPTPSVTSVIDFEADSRPEQPVKCHFTVDEKAVYEDALQV
jgi:hypothetical protein